MPFRSLLWLALFPLLAASASSRIGLHPESRASLERFSASKASDGDDAAVRSAGVVAVRIVGRSRNQNDLGGTGSIRAARLSQRISSREVECTAVRLAAWRSSYATVAHGGPLIYFPTAPPIHG